jgi:hypothetical protein
LALTTAFYILDWPGRTTDGVIAFPLFTFMQLFRYYSIFMVKEKVYHELLSF